MNAVSYAQLKRLFQRAIELDFDERQRYLAEECQECPELLQEVQSLLEHHEPKLDENGAQRESRLDTRTTAPGPAAAAFLWPRMMGSPLTFHRNWLYLGMVFSIAAILVAGAWVYRSAHNQLLDSEMRRLETSCQALSTSVSDILERELWWADRSVNRRAIGQIFQSIVEESERSPENPAAWYTQENVRVAHRHMAMMWGEKVGFNVYNRQHRLIFGSPGELQSCGKFASSAGRELLSRIWEGESIVCFPDQFESLFATTSTGQAVADIGILIPLRGSNDEVNGVLLLRGTGVAERIQAAFDSSHFLETGEVYAFSRAGYALSRPRHFEESIQLGLFKADGENLTAQRLWLRDPGRELKQSAVPSLDINSRPLTQIVRQSLNSDQGVVMSAYRDYRGQLVYGAWKWLEPYDMGVIAEVDEVEVLARLREFDLGFLIGASVLVLTGVVISSVLVKQQLSRKRNEQRIGEYLLESPLGEGGMGTVYKARDERLQRSVAVKILNPELAFGRSLRYFTREVQFASRLRHPNTVQILDFGQTSAGSCFLVTELLNGVTFYEMVRAFGSLPTGRAIYLLKQVCGSLSEAHRMGYSHRDIKPHNLMVCHSGGEPDWVKVLDFGLIKETDADSKQGDSHLFEWAGTLRYSAPERLLMPHLVDHRSDIYSFGAVAYWLLTGREIFADVQDDELLRDIVLNTPFPPEALAQHPPELSRLVRQCLAKELSQRPQTIRDVQGSLEQLSLRYPWDIVVARTWWNEFLPNCLTAADSEPMDAAQEPLEKPLLTRQAG